MIFYVLFISFTCSSNSNGEPITRYLSNALFVSAKKGNCHRLIYVKQFLSVLYSRETVLEVCLWTKRYKFLMVLSKAIKKTIPIDDALHLHPYAEDNKSIFYATS